MKYRILVRFSLAAGLVLGVSGCKSYASGSLTEAQKAAIKQEIQQVARALVQANERADAEATLKFYVGSPDFPQSYADPAGKLMDFEGLRQAAVQTFAEASSFTVTVRTEAVTVLDADTVLYAWQGAWHGTMKNAAIFKTDSCAVTMLFKRIGKDWKVVYQHESYAPPQEVKP